MKKAKAIREIKLKCEEKIKIEVEISTSKVQKSVNFLETSKIMLDENKANIFEAKDKLDVLKRMLTDKIS